MEEHALSAVRHCLFNILAVTLHIGDRSSIRNLRTRHAAATRTHSQVHINNSSHTTRYFAVVYHMAAIFGPNVGHLQAIIQEN